jgi:hypothetical protein
MRQLTMQEIGEMHAIREELERALLVFTAKHTILMNTQANDQQEEFVKSVQLAEINREILVILKQLGQDEGIA